MNKKTLLIILAILVVLIIGIIAMNYFSRGEPSGKLDGTACTMDYSPVCGIDGITYGNKCMAGKIQIAYSGECETTASGDAAGGTVLAGSDTSGMSDEELAAA